MEYKSLPVTTYGVGVAVKLLVDNVLHRYNTDKMHKRSYCNKFTYIGNSVVNCWVTVGVITSLKVAVPINER